MNFYEPRMRELNAVPYGYFRGLLPIHVTEAHMQEAERLLGARLPEDYREFIRDFGIFYVPQMDFPIKPAPNTWPVNYGSISIFGGIVIEEQKSNYDLMEEYFYFIENDEDWPKEWIPIGSYESYYIALDLKGGTKGSVYYIMDHNPFLVSPSFDDFIQLLYPRYTEPVETEYSNRDAANFWATFST